MKLKDLNKNQLKVFHNNKYGIHLKKLNKNNNNQLLMNNVIIKIKFSFIIT